MQSFIKGIISLLYPSYCYACGVYLPPLPPAALCPACRQQVRFITPPYCPRCGRPFLAGSAEEPSHLCELCMWKSPPFSSARALAEYGPEVGALIHQFKYGRKRHLGFLLAGLAATHKRLLTELTPVDAIVPVPLHPRRRRKRGFNQAEVFARFMARYVNAPVVADQLRKVRDTPPQTGLSREERLKNVRGAFGLGSRWHYAHHHLRSAYSALRRPARY
ncbi:MAG: double zinc ribbon domain-containing protein, partial [Candidatus Aminicenantes bacterium]|nr:double zinc ribbon domain-containing protein [Candidatus Aminicenantes bacterium]